MKSCRAPFHALLCTGLVSLVCGVGAGASQFPLDPGSLPGGIPDNFVFLLMSNPYAGQKNVALDAPVTFTFISPMAPKQSITWSGNVQSVNFTYTWSADGTTLTCTHTDKFPANATITWTLEPTGFSDKSGSPLMAINNSGQFTTGSSDTNPNPCSGTSTNTGGGAFSLFKSVHYVQTSASAPVLDTEDGATFAAMISSPKTNPVSQASIKLPNGSTKALTNFFGAQFMFYETFPSEQALETAYPAGSYVVTIQRQSGTAVLTMNLPANAAPPTPQIVNFAQTQAFDPTVDFNLQWLPYTGVTDKDSLSINLDDGAGTSFYAPDPCIPRPLPNTATSIVVPKNTFGVTTHLQGWLSFGRITAWDTNSVPGIGAFGGYSKMTNFKLQEIGIQPPTAPQLINLVRQQNGTVSFQVKATAGATLSVEGSTDLETWFPVMMGMATTATVNVSDTQAAGLPYRFYRATLQAP